MFKTKLRNVRSYDTWVMEMGDDAEAMLAAFHLGQEVTVVGLSTGDTGNPDCNLYDIELQDKTTINAIPGAYLLNIADFKHQRGIQFSLELLVEDGAGQPLDHEEMRRQLTFAIERAMINFGYRGRKTTVGLVQYQTEYDIPA